MKLMVRVLEEADLTRPQQSILVAMAENANDDGSSCRPSIDLIAWKAGYKPRNVVDIIRALRKLGVLEVVREATAQRPTEYRIHLDRAPRKLTFEEWQRAHGRYRERGPYGPETREIAPLPHDETQEPVSLNDPETREIAPLANDETREIAPVQSDEGCNLTSRGVQSRVRGMQSHGFETREIAPDPVKRPSQTQSRTQPTHTRVRATDSLRQSFETFWAAYPRGYGNKQATWVQWQRLEPDPEMVEVILLALDGWKASDRWQRGFVKSAQKWVEEHWWDDDPPPPAEDDLPDNVRLPPRPPDSVSDDEAAAIYFRDR